MNLEDLKSKLSKDASFRRQYERLGDSVALAMHARAVREETGLSQTELASELGISASDVSQFEALDRIDPAVVSLIVDRFEVRLGERGIETKRWIIPSAEKKQHNRNVSTDRPSGRLDLPGRNTPLVARRETRLRQASEER